MEKPMLEDITAKASRIRRYPIIKWTKQHTATLLAAIKENGMDQFEKPTAQTFYNRILGSKPDLKDYTWKSARDKIKNLKMKYKTAMEWKLKQADVDDAKKIRDNVLHFCPQFEVLNEIFSERIAFDLPMMLMDTANDSHSFELPKKEFQLIETIVEDEVEETSLLAAPSPPWQLEEVRSLHGNVEEAPSRTRSVEEAPSRIRSVEEAPSRTRSVEEAPSRTRSVEEAPSSSKRKERASSSTTDSLVLFLAQVQQDRLKYLERKLAFKEKKDDSAKEMKILQLELDTRRLEADINLRKEEAQMKNELKRLRIKQKFELKKLELELKYKYKLSSS